MKREAGRFRFILLLAGVLVVLAGCYGGAATPETTSDGEPEPNGGGCTVSGMVREAGTVGNEANRALAMNNARQRMTCQCGTPRITDQQCEHFGEKNWSCVISYRCEE